jgi:hypothetical protein
MVVFLIELKALPSIPLTWDQTYRVSVRFLHSSGAFPRMGRKIAVSLNAA